MTSQINLLATCWTTAGDVEPKRGDEVSPHPLKERINAASAAGFRGMGLVHADLVRVRDTVGYAEAAKMMDDAGIAHREVEFLVDWWCTGEAKRRSDQVRDELLLAAEALRADRIKVGAAISDGPYARAQGQAERWSEDQWGAAFHDLCERAAGVGARVALEFMPLSNLRTISDGLKVVRASGHPAGGVMVDIWHVERAGTTLQEVAQARLEEIAGVELNDANRKVIGTLWDDTIKRRKYCGDGEFDIKSFIGCLREMGWTGPWGVEILSSELRTMDLTEGVRKAADTTVAQFVLQP